MVYRNEHWDCKEIECMQLVAYVRIEGNWVKIGHYGSECKKFEPLDLQKEEQNRLTKERIMQISTEMRQIKQENRARLKIIESELNVNKSFFK